MCFPEDHIKEKKIKIKRTTKKQNHTVIQSFVRKLLLLQISTLFALKIKFPSTRRWEREPKSFKLTEIKKGTQPGGWGGGGEGGEGVGGRESKGKAGKGKREEGEG